MTHDDGCVLTSGGSTEAHRLLRHHVEVHRWSAQGRHPRQLTADSDLSVYRRNGFNWPRGPQRECRSGFNGSEHVRLCRTNHVSAPPLTCSN